MLGMDISTSRIWAVEISRNKGELQLEKFNFLDFDYPLHDKSSNSDHILQEAIINLLHKGSFSAKSTTLCVYDGLILTKIIQAGINLKPRELEWFVTMEAKRVFKVDDILLDFIRMGPAEKNPAMLDILIVACRASSIQLNVSVCRRAGLSPSIIEPQSQAMKRVFPFLKKDSAQNKKYIALLYIQLTQVQLYVFNQEILFFKHHASYTNYHSATKIMHTKECSQPQAEEDEQHLIKCIMAMFQFYSINQPGKAIEHIFLAGEVKGQSKILSKLNYLFHCSISLANRFTGINFSHEISEKKLESVAPSMLLAFGLALRQAHYA